MVIVSREDEYLRSSRTLPVRHSPPPVPEWVRLFSDWDYFHRSSIIRFRLGVYTSAMATKPEKAPAPVDSVYTALQSLSKDIAQQLQGYEAMRKARKTDVRDALKEKLFELLDDIEQQLDEVDPVLNDKARIGAGVYTEYVGLRNMITGWRRVYRVRRGRTTLLVREPDFWDLVEHTGQRLSAIGPELNQKPVEELPVRITFGRPCREGKVLIAGHFAPEVQAALRRIAEEEETTVQRLLAEALHLLFAKRGRRKRA